jgi:aspartate aminotransferase
MEFSRRITSVQPSPTLALNAKAIQLKKQGHKVLNFAVGEPDYPTAPVVVDRAIESLKAGRTKYTPAGGGPELRQAIADKLLRDNGLTYNVNQIVAGAGAKEVLFHTFLSLLNDGDEVLLTAPYWVSYGDQIRAAGGVPITVPIPDHGGFPSLETIEKYATKRTKAFVFNSPNNPAGYVLGEKELKTLGDYLHQKSWWVISDEIYEYMSFDVPHASLVKVCPELTSKFVLVNGLSKAFAMTGWRVGYCAAPLELAGMVRSLQSHSSTCIPGFIEDASVVALKAGKPLMEKDIERLKARRDLAINYLRELGGLKFLVPQGAYYIFIDIRQYLKNGETTLQFSDRLLTEHHLALAPGEAFGAPGFLRISFAIDDATILEGIQRLHKAIFGSK